MGNDLNFGKVSDEKFEGSVVKWFHAKGYGFIECDGKEYFVHITKVKGNQALEPGQKISFKKINTMKGVQCCEVELV